MSAQFATGPSSVLRVCDNDLDHDLDDFAT
jgi:hypothetical protein